METQEKTVCVTYWKEIIGKTKDDFTGMEDDCVWVFSLPG